MSTKILERNVSFADDYVMVRDRLCVMDHPDVETSAWMAMHTEYAAPVGKVTTALVECFKDFGGNVRVSIEKDAETGDESVLFTINTKMDGAKARALLDEFLDEGFPECARDFEDDFVFSVNPTGAISR